MLIMYHILHLCQKIVQYMLYCLFECVDGMNCSKSASFFSQALLGTFNLFTAVAVCVREREREREGVIQCISFNYGL
jgi:hypothetical protein